MCRASTCPASISSKSPKAMAATPCALRKSSELAPALKRALAHKGTSLVEVIVDSAVPLLYTQKGADAPSPSCEQSAE